MLQVAELTKRTECAELDLKELQDVFEQSRHELDETLDSLRVEHQKIYQELHQYVTIKLITFINNFLIIKI